jgi:hypothetical protein
MGDHLIGGTLSWSGLFNAARSVAADSPGRQISPIAENRQLCGRHPTVI